MSNQPRNAAWDGATQPYRRIIGPTLLEWLIFFALAAFLMYLIMPMVQHSRTDTSSPNCKTNLKQIGLALLNYHDVYGCFPPAYVADAEGRRLHSWRVLLLPFLDYDAVYKRYRFDEPWDGPHNRMLHAEKLAIYNCPTLYRRPMGAASMMTNYVAVVGPTTVWPGTTCTNQSQITDGVEKTISVVESTNSGIHWMEPRDFDLPQLLATHNTQSSQKMSSVHEKGPNALFVDGAVKTLPETIPASGLRALLTRSGGESVPNF